MAFDFKKKGGFGKKKGGFNKRFEGGYGQDKRDDRRSEMFEAVCAACGADCRVPFKPNGRKPVHCSDCFRREGNDSARSFGGDDRFERSSRPSHGGGNEDVVKQLRMLNEKMDELLDAIDAMMAAK